MIPFAANRPDARANAGRNASTLLDSVPGLRDAGEKLVGSIARQLQVMAGPATIVESRLVTVSRERARESLSGLGEDIVCASIECAAPRVPVLAVMDGPLVHALLELMCGGSGTEPMRSTPREATAIDRQFAHILVTLAASAMQRDWADIGFGPARAVRIDGAIPSDFFGLRAAEVCVLTASIGIFGFRGSLRLMFGAAVLDHLGSALSAEIPAPQADPVWEDGLKREVGRAPLRLDACLLSRSVSLAEIAGLRVGQMLALPRAAPVVATVFCDGTALYEAEVGQADGHYTLRISAMEPDAVIRHTAPRARRAAFHSEVVMSNPSSLQESPEPSGQALDAILGLPVEVRVFLGSVSLPIAEVMKLSRGSVLTLDHDIGNPVDVVVNGRVVARGELVALDQDPSKIGVKLTDVVGRTGSAN